MLFHCIILQLSVYYLSSQSKIDCKIGVTKYKTYLFCMVANTFKWWFDHLFGVSIGKLSYSNDHPGKIHDPDPLPRNVHRSWSPVHTRKTSNLVQTFCWGFPPTFFFEEFFLLLTTYTALLSKKWVSVFAQFIIFENVCTLYSCISYSKEG